MLRSDFYVNCLSLGASHHLMKHNFGVWKRDALARLSRGQKHRSHGGGRAYANSADIGLYILHSVIDCKPRAHRPARRIYIELYILLRIFAFKKQKLRDNSVGKRVCYNIAQKYNSFFEKARVNIIRPLPII